MASSWGGKPHTLYFFQSQRIWRKVLNKIRQTENPFACCYGKTGDRPSLVKKSGDFHSRSGDFHYFIKNREISRQIGRLGSSDDVQPMSLTRKCELQNTRPNNPTNAPFPPIYVPETCSCQQLPPAFFLSKNNKPMEQSAYYTGVRIHRGCLQ